MVLEEIPIAPNFDLLAKLLRRISVAFLSNYFSNRRCQHELDIEWMNRCWLNGGQMSVANCISRFCQTPPPAHWHWQTPNSAAFGFTAPLRYYGPQTAAEKYDPDGSLSRRKGGEIEYYDGCNW